MTADEIEEERIALRTALRDIATEGDRLRAEMQSLDPHPPRDVLIALGDRLLAHSARLQAYHDRLEALHAVGANLSGS